jgi:alkanesulfonate monooxygenase SsuD/methylene tetrahydromethanopterin reductase-like flavin-dependent oxidoreductase (luciferase family)
VKLGYGLLSCQRGPGETRPDAELYAEALTLATRAEAIGLDSVWTSEHHFADDAYLSAQLPVLAAIAARTSRITVGSGLYLLPLYEPLHAAEDAATVDLISGGRLVLGVGLGWRAEEFEALGLRTRDRVRRLEAGITVLRQAWREPWLVEGDGEVFHYPRVNVTPHPARPGGPPIWIGAMAEPAVRRAGRIGDGLMATEASPAVFGEQVRWALEALHEAGRDPAAFEVAIHRPVFTWRGADPWAVVGRSHWYTTWKYEDMELARGSVVPRELPAIPAGREAVLRADLLAGPPELVAEGIAAYERAAGMPVHFIARSWYPGVAAAINAEALSLLGEVRVLLGGA